MSLTMGPNTGLLINGAPGEGHYSELIRMLRWDDFLRQPVVKGRVATLPTSGQAEGDTYIFTGAGANQNRLARWWATGASTPIWEYMPPRLGWRVQVANETTPAGQVKTYEYSGSAWTELVGGMADAPSDGKRYARLNNAWAGLGTAAVADILGPVSQAGGIPSGAIIERGSNANGEYVRFADGTQICIVTLLGNGSQQPGTPITLPLPAAFLGNYTTGVSVSWAPHVSAPSVANGVKVAYANGSKLFFTLQDALATNRLIFTLVGRWF